MSLSVNSELFVRTSSFFIHSLINCCWSYSFVFSSVPPVKISRASYITQPLTSPPNLTSSPAALCAVSHGVPCTTATQPFPYQCLQPQLLPAVSPAHHLCNTVNYSFPSHWFPTSAPTSSAVSATTLQLLSLQWKNLKPFPICSGLCSGSNMKQIITHIFRQGQATFGEQASCSMRALRKELCCTFPSLFLHQVALYFVSC